MTRDDIIRMAKNEYGIYAFTAESLERFAALVAAAEREQCAKVCEEFQGSENDEEAWKYAAAAIRARGE